MPSTYIQIPNFDLNSFFGVLVFQHGVPVAAAPAAQAPEPGTDIRPAEQQVYSRVGSRLDDDQPFPSPSASHPHILTYS